VTDDTGGGRTALAAPGLLSGATTIPIEYVKLVWAVQAITDQCVTPDDFPKDLEEYKEFSGNDEAKQEDYDAYYRTYCLDPAHRMVDTPQVVQTYDDNWYLTGMSIREDHGLRAAAHENPDAHAAYPRRKRSLAAVARPGRELPVPARLREADRRPRSPTTGNAPSHDPRPAVQQDDLRDLPSPRRTAGRNGRRQLHHSDV
jgi:hypothetical protein